MGKALDALTGSNKTVVKEAKRVEKIPPPVVKPPAPMPDEEALKKQAATELARKPRTGRDSTNLVQDYEDSVG